MHFPVTVIIPCHNAQQWLSSTLASVAAQTLPPQQVILIADNCTDGSVQIAQKFDLPIQIIQTDFGNAGPARNAGIRIADTPWIALLDADDHWLPDHLKNAASILSDSDHVAYCAGHRFMDNQNQPLALPSCFWQGWVEPHTKLTHTDYVELMLREMHFGHSTVIYRRDRFVEVGEFNPQQVRRHDIDLWLRMIHDHLWAYHPGPAALYRYQTPGSISRNMVEVTYYQLSALQRNRQAYAQTKLDQLIKSYAQRAASVAFHNADSVWREKLNKIAFADLSVQHRCFYRCVKLCPWFFKLLVIIKRQTLGRLQRFFKKRHDAKSASKFSSQETS